MRYAKALLAYAKAQKVEDRVYEEVKTLAGHYVSLPGFTPCDRKSSAQHAE